MPTRCSWISYPLQYSLPSFDVYAWARWSCAHPTFVFVLIEITSKIKHEIKDFHLNYAWLKSTYCIARIAVVVLCRDWRDCTNRASTSTNDKATAMIKLMCPKPKIKMGSYANFGLARAHAQKTPIKHVPKERRPSSSIAQTSTLHHRSRHFLAHLLAIKRSIGIQSP